MTRYDSICEETTYCDHHLDVTWFLWSCHLGARFLLDLLIPKPNAFNALCEPVLPFTLRLDML